MSSENSGLPPETTIRRTFYCPKCLRAVDSSCTCDEDDWAEIGDDWYTAMMSGRPG